MLPYPLTDNFELERVRKFDEVGSSELMAIECKRVLYRYRLEGSISDRELAEVLTCFDDLFSTFRSFAMTSSVKRVAAGAFPTIIELWTRSTWQRPDSGRKVTISRSPSSRSTNR